MVTFRVGSSQSRKHGCSVFMSTNALEIDTWASDITSWLAPLASSTPIANARCSICVFSATA